MKRIIALNILALMIIIAVLLFTPIYMAVNGDWALLEAIGIVAGVILLFVVLGFLFDRAEKSIKISK